MRVTGVWGDNRERQGTTCLSRKVTKCFKFSEQQTDLEILNKSAFVKIILIYKVFIYCHLKYLVSTKLTHICDRFLQILKDLEINNVDM